jgi:glycosyltransferase involved in cell wall biosynthesis
VSENPKASVVIACYNRAGLLQATIESVIAQTFRDYEVIVVDDGSTDETRELVASYGDKIRYYYQENRGPSAARNYGVRQSRAPWIAIQDSDDLCTANHLETLYGYAREHPECGMVFGNGSYLGDTDRHRSTIIPATKSKRLAGDGVSLIDLFERSLVRLQAALISKSCYDAVGGHDESLRICMDLDLAFRLFMKYPVTYLDRTVFQYRRHEGNIGRDEELRLMENIRVIEKLVTEFPRAKELLGQKTIDRRTAYRYYRLAKGRWKRRQYEAAREAIRLATGLAPRTVKYWFYRLQWGAAALT